MELRRADLDADPARQFERWYAEAAAAQHTMRALTAISAFHFGDAKQSESQISNRTLGLEAVLKDGQRLRRPTAPLYTDRSGITTGAIGRRRLNCYTDRFRTTTCN